MFTAESVSIALTMSTTFTTAMAAAMQIFSLINRIPLIDAHSEDGKKTPNQFIQGRINFENVEFSYPTRTETQVLQGLTLEIKPHQVTALVGASGCGKSSCIGLIERWYDPSSGMLFIFPKWISFLDFNLLFRTSHVRWNWLEGIQHPMVAWYCGTCRFEI